MELQILVVGMNPGPQNTNPNKSHTRDRLEKWMTIADIKYYSFCNTFDEVGSADKSKINFDRLKSICLGYNKIIALGNFASEALDVIRIKHFKLPHPSPRNRLLNDKAYEEKVLKECKEYLDEIS